MPRGSAGRMPTTTSAASCGITGRMEEETLWFYRGLVEAFRTAGPEGHLIDEMEGVVGKLERQDQDLS